MRDADVQLHDAACDVLLAAQHLRASATADAGGVTAAAPVLGCLQEALDELCRAVEGIEGHAAAAAPAGTRPLRVALDDLGAVLRLASAAAEAARATAARSPLATAP